MRAWPPHSDYYFAPGIYNTIYQQADNWDLIHCQGYNTFVAPLAMGAAWRAGIPYVITERNFAVRRLQASKAGLVRAFSRRGACLGLLARVVIWEELGRTIALPTRKTSIFGPEVSPILYHLTDEQKELIRHLVVKLKEES